MDSEFPIPPIFYPIKKFCACEHSFRVGAQTERLTLHCLSQPGFLRYSLKTVLLTALASVLFIQAVKMSHKENQALSTLN